MEYFEDNPEIFAALVAAIAILGGLLGSVIGARIQANGGRDQAAAAREAAQIAAEAQRVAALWTVRQVQVAELIRTANALIEMCDRLWLAGGDELAGQLTAASAAVSSRWNEVRLIVTEKVEEAAGELARSAIAVEENSQQNAPVIHARNHLARIVGDDQNVANEIAEIVAADEDAQDRSRALCNIIPGLSEEHAYHYVAFHRISSMGIMQRTNRVRHDFNEALSALVREAREMLRAQDDVAPAPATQRRRWRHRSALLS
ncbi:hypothetical protein ACFVVP_26355 [Streptomyces sp. NPDC058128]|uniref:hypothetical protein n=1 Tax=Streptomyces sp. NPDC058128 TaxID=3346352 RepID=UPI0036EEA33C